jgi:hypothetical protein
MAAPVETKVQASTGAAAVSGLALFLLGRYVFRDSGVPDVVASWVYVLVPGAITFVAGYLAKHTSVPGPAVASPVVTPAAAVAQGLDYIRGQYGPGSGPPLTAMPPTASQSVTPAPQGAAAEKLGGPPA